MNNNNIVNEKLCVKCQQIKALNTDFFYKAAGNSFQKLCKICHNQNRCLYINNRKPYVNTYIKKPIGFYKYPVDVQEAIKHDIFLKIKYKDIALKYGIDYQTMLKYKKKGIPPYVPNNNEIVHEIVNDTIPETI